MYLFRKCELSKCCGERDLVKYSEKSFLTARFPKIVPLSTAKRCLRARYKKVWRRGIRTRDGWRVGQRRSARFLPQRRHHLNGESLPISDHHHLIPNICGSNQSGVWRATGEFRHESGGFGITPMFDGHTQVQLVVRFFGGPWSCRAGSGCLGGELDGLD